MEPVREARCLKCALPVPAADEGAAVTCLECRRKPPPLEWMDSWGRYDGPLEAALHALKFRGHDFLAESLADLLFARMIEHGDLRFDALVPVPLHRRRLQRRGFNQAEILARSLSKKTAVPVVGILRKTRDNEPQSTLQKRARNANVKGAFVSRRHTVGMSLLIVDDVCTTGATLRSCARALLAAGAERVCAVTVARA